MELTETTLKHEILYHGRIIRLALDEARLPDGKTASREYVMHNGGVCVLPLTENNEILFVRQYRYPYHEEVLEIPAGKRDSADEEPLLCGKRELREETGATADEWISLGTMYPSPGYCDEVIYMYLAKGLHYGKDDRDEDEFLNVERIPFEKALQMVMYNEIVDAKTQIAILKTANILEKR